MNTDLLEQKFNVLPDDLKREVLDFIDFLMTKRKKEKIQSQFDFTWEGGLADLRDDFNSVDLQHHSMEWR
ncbi:toxin-antitoxin system, antitoxin component, Xre family [delta proteobacterium NaphS2]|nr:toxin-antitoxin system, antitoxin component, Xre family [delta proteobacterium NaphS2]